MMAATMAGTRKTIATIHGTIAIMTGTIDVKTVNGANTNGMSGANNPGAIARTTTTTLRDTLNLGIINLDIINPVAGSTFPGKAANT